MELVTDPRLREIIEQIRPHVEANPAPAVRQPPSNPAERDAWFADVTQERQRQQDQTVQMSGGGAPAPDGVEVTDVRIPVTGTCGWAGCGPCTAGAIDAIVYRPLGAHDAPAQLNFHGGGFWIGGGLEMLRLSAPVLGARALKLGVVVVDVDYRMAPTHKFPVPVEDCYAALTWVAANAGQLSADTSRIAVGGSSAGGTLAAAVALMTRDREGPALSALVLHIPVTDSSCNTASMRQLAEGYTMTRQHALEMWDMYLATPADAHHPYASPAHAATLRGLPPALFVLGDYDVLRDEGQAFAQRLVDDGVTVTVRRLPQTHGALLPENWPETERLVRQHLRANLLGP
nr:alpha/beta hydrolase [Dactylosporangium thailandense]